MMEFLADDIMNYEGCESHPNTSLSFEESGNIGQRASPTYDETVLSSGGISAFQFDPSFAMTSAHTLRSGNANISSNLWSTENTAQLQPVAQNTNHSISYPAQQESHVWTNGAAAIQGFTQAPYVNTDKTLVGSPGTSASSHANFDDERSEALEMPIAPAAPPIPSAALTSTSYIAPVKKNLARTTEKDWTMHRPTIKSLYIDCNMTLDDTMRKMEEEHGFFAS